MTTTSQSDSVDTATTLFISLVKSSDRVQSSLIVNDKLLNADERYNSNLGTVKVVLPKKEKSQELHKPTLE